MAQYTIEDIEIIRQKSGVTYEEAVNLLEYHNGSLARALVDLEKNGRIKQNSGSSGARKGFQGVFNFLYRLRLKVKKNDVVIVNLSSLFFILTLIVAPHICIIGLIVSLLLGYRITIERNSQDFQADTLDSVVKNVKTNVQGTVDNISRQFAHTQEKTAQNDEQPKSAAQPRTESAPSGTTPVNVQFPGSANVDVHDDGDGYHEADIQ